MSIVISYSEFLASMARMLNIPLTLLSRTSNSRALPADRDGQSDDEIDDDNEGREAESADEAPHNRTSKRRRDEPESESHPRAAPPRKKALKRRGGRTPPSNAEAPEDVVKQVTIDLSQDADVTVVKRGATAFLKVIMDMTQTITRDNRDIKKKFTSVEARDITNFFFVEMMGPNAFTRLQSLVQGYSSARGDGTDRGAATRALAAAQIPLPEKLENVTRFFTTYAHTEYSKEPSNTALAHLHQLQLHMDLLAQFNELRVLAAAQDPTLMDWLYQSNYRTSRGVSRQTLILNYLADQIGIKTTVLQNHCQVAVGVTQLVEKFGKGILAILPPGSMRKWVLPSHRSRPIR
jgi:hypothetical protein